MPASTLYPHIMSLAHFTVGQFSHITIWTDHADVYELFVLNQPQCLVSENSSNPLSPKWAIVNISIWVYVGVKWLISVQRSWMTTRYSGT